MDLKVIVPSMEEKNSIETSTVADLKNVTGDRYSDLYELIIIGGGPAGMTAAVYSARKKINTLLLTKDIGGQVLLTADIENYMGYQYVTGRELIDKFQEQIERFPIDILVDSKVEKLTANQLRRSDYQFTATTRACAEARGNGKEFTAKSVIIASGKRSRPLNVPGEKELVGRGVSYCSTCDAPLFGGMDVAVIGGGNSALEAAIDLIKIANKVYVVNVAKSWQGDEILADQVEAARNVTSFLGYGVAEISGSNRVEGITIEAQDTGESVKLAVGGVFIEIGLLPNSDFAKDLVELNRAGEIVVNCGCKTSLEGVFSAGDVTSVPEKQIIVAAGEGAKAALSAYQYLLKSR